MTTPDILARVRKLLRLADQSQNSSPQEAAAAAAKAQTLIDQYQLSAALLADDQDQDADPADQEPIVDWGSRHAPLHTAGRQERWTATLASLIASYNAARVYLQGGSIHLIGRPSDVETVRYLFDYVIRQINALADKHATGYGLAWKNNYRLGCVDAVRKTLREQRDRFRADARAQAAAADQPLLSPIGGTTIGPGTALVRVNAALAKIDQRKATVDQWTKDNVKLTAGRGSRSSYDPYARNLGREHGKTIGVGGRTRAALKG